MSGKRYSVRRWTKPVLQAAAMRVGPCLDSVGLVGFDMVGQDGKPFAHGHMEIETAERLANDLSLAIADAKRKAAH